MRFSEWINKIIESGLLCEAYTDKVEEAKSKKRLMDIVLDSNGQSYLCDPLEGRLVAADFQHFGKQIRGRSPVCTACPVGPHPI